MGRSSALGLVDRERFGLVCALRQFDEIRSWSERVVGKVRFIVKTNVCFLLVSTRRVIAGGRESQYWLFKVTDRHAHDL